MGAVADQASQANHDETSRRLRLALLDAIQLCEGWVMWKCPKRHREEHLAHLHQLYLVADPSVALDPAKLSAHLAAEREVFVRLLVECDKVLSTLEAETTWEEASLKMLRTAIDKITTPHRPEEGSLLDIRRRLNG